MWGFAILVAKNCVSGGYQSRAWVHPSSSRWYANDAGSMVGNFWKHIFRNFEGCHRVVEVNAGLRAPVVTVLFVLMAHDLEHSLVSRLKAPPKRTFHTLFYTVLERANIT